MGIPYLRKCCVCCVRMYILFHMNFVSRQFFVDFIEVCVLITCVQNNLEMV